jgi:hypothetical protein
VCYAVSDKKNMVVAYEEVPSVDMFQVVSNLHFTGLNNKPCAVVVNFYIRMLSKSCCFCRLVVHLMSMTMLLWMLYLMLRKLQTACYPRALFHVLHAASVSTVPHRILQEFMLLDLINSKTSVLGYEL